MIRRDPREAVVEEPWLAAAASGSNSRIIGLDWIYGYISLECEEEKDEKEFCSREQYRLLLEIDLRVFACSSSFRPA